MTGPLVGVSQEESVKTSDIPAIRTQRLVLSLPQVTDAPELLAYGLKNEVHLAPWSPPAPQPSLTLELYERLVEDIQRELASGISVRFWLRLGEEFTGRFIGAVSLSQIVLGAFRACYLGYHVDHEHEGQGYVSEAVAAAIQYAFGELKLHRIMANYMPANRRSARLLERLGFEEEGYAKQYLFIAGRWEDHILTALTNRELTGANQLVSAAHCLGPAESIK